MIFKSKNDNKIKKQSEVGSAQIIEADYNSTFTFTCHNKICYNKQLKVRITSLKT